MIGSKEPAFRTNIELHFCCRHRFLYGNVLYYNSQIHDTEVQGTSMFLVEGWGGDGWGNTNKKLNDVL